MEHQLPNLTKPEIARLLYLSTFVQFDTNKITHDNGRNIDDKDLVIMLKFKPRQYKAFIKKLIDNGLMTIREIAKEYGITPQGLNYILEEEGVQYKKYGEWIPYEAYAALKINTK